MRSVGALVLGPPDVERLSEGAAAFGIALDEQAVRRFCRFARLLESWGARINLISCEGPSELVERHFLDSLAISGCLLEAADVIDLGSGAGFPGVPLAIVRASRRIVLVEPRRRRANFLREVRRVLALPNVEIIEARAEDRTMAKKAPADAAVFRAVWSGPEGVSLACSWVRTQGIIIHMRGGPEPVSAFQGKGVAREMRGTVLEQSIDYRIGTGRQRTIDVYRVRAE